MSDKEDSDFEQDSELEKVDNTHIGPKAEATIKISFGTKEFADIARQVLEVDKSRFSDRQFTVEGDYLITQISTSTPKGVRNAITAFFDQMLLCKDTIDAFAINSDDKVEKHDITTKSEDKNKNNTDTATHSEEKNKEIDNVLKSVKNN